MVRKAYNSPRKTYDISPSTRRGESALTRKRYRDLPKAPGGGRQVATLQETLKLMREEQARTGIAPGRPSAMLPQLNPHAAPLKYGQIVHGPVDANFVGTVTIGYARPVEIAAAAGKAVARSSWRHRWQLAPFTAVPFVATCTAMAPTVTTFGLAASTVAAHAAATHAPETFAGRKWLSTRERSMAAAWTGAAGMWAAGVSAQWWQPNLIGLSLLVAAVAAPTVGWLRSRRVRVVEGEVTHTLSAEARQLEAAWPDAIAADEQGSPALLGSAIVPGTMSEPSNGTYAFTVQLREGVHAEQAIEPSVRRYLEARMALGRNTAGLEVDRNNVTRIHVTLTPSRHLEKVAADWRGPILHADGTIDLAVTDSGAVVRAALFNESGVEHFIITGTTNSGKSYTTGVMLLPGVIARREVVFYADGGAGSSAPHLAGACDWVAMSDREMNAQIRCAHAIMRARKERRAMAGIGHWRGTQETDPVLTLCIDEATTAKSMIGEHEQNLVHEILREGRKLGVRCGQITQDSMGDALIGGRGARDLMMGGGIAIGHRPGGKVASMLATGSSAESIDLTALPPGPGWAGIIRAGQIQAKAARVLYASAPKVLTELSGLVPRGLDGADAAAAGESYQVRRRGHEVAARMRAAEAGTPIQGALIGADMGAVDDDAPGAANDGADGALDGAVGADTPVARILSGSQRAARGMRKANCATIVSTLLAHDGGPLTRGQIADHTRINVKTISRALDDLHAEGRVKQAEGRAWELVRAAAAA